MAAGMVVGCESEPRGPRSEARLESRDSAGVVIVQNSISEPRLLDAQEVRRIGLVEGPEAYMLAQVTAVAVSSSDTVFVGNSLSGSVRMFDPQGTFVREFGGRGQGPSEVRDIADVWLTGDTVVLRERGGRWKTVLFRTSGQFIRSWPGVRADGSWMLTVAHGSNGWIVEHWPRGPYEGEPGDSVGDRQQLRLYDPDADLLGGIVFDAPRRPTYITDAGHPDQALFRVFGSGFDDQGRFYRTKGAAYEIAIYSTEGRLARLIRRSIEPRPVGPEHVEEYRHLVQAVLDTLTAYGPPGTIDDQVLTEIGEAADLPLPDYWAPIRELIVSSEGLVWAEFVADISPGALEIVNLFGPTADDRLGPTRWDIFEPNGGLIGQVELPRMFKPMAARDVEITGVWLDELGVEYVITYRAVPEAARPAP